MLNNVLNLLAPHHCYGCQKTGSLLCDNCKYNIVNDPFSGCLICRNACGERGLCGRCRVPYERAWCVADRADELAQLIDGYKLNRQIDAAKVVGQLIASRLPPLDSEIIVVPIPTIPRHIRQRGFDHTLVIATEIARRHGIQLQAVVRRRENSVQRLASRKQRFMQAEHAYRVDGALSSTATYLLIDDVFTTGATLTATTELVMAAGASHVWVAVGARQPLDDKR